jgi:hypothetical protein
MAQDMRAILLARAIAAGIAEERALRMWCDLNSIEVGD